MTPMREARVLIIGAGAAGMAAAEVLHRQGVDVAILEARKRTGGRIWSIHDPALEVPIELGAEFVDANTPAVAETATRLGVELVPLRGEVHDLKQKKACGLFAPKSRYRISGGCERLITELGRGVRIETGTAAAAVRRSPHQVQVETSKGEWRAERLILAVPLPVLRDAARLRIDPELPGLRAAATQLGMEKAIRISIQFSEDFWHERAPNLLLIESEDPAIPEWWTTHPVRSAVITGWAAGRRAANLSGLPAEVLLERALESLGRCLREPVKELVRLVVRHWCHDWQSDPFALGGYSKGAGPNATATAELARPAARDIFIAGEATNSDSRAGTVNGALESGRRAARQALESLTR